MTQKELILTSNKKINEIILLCAENNITVPNEIKIIFYPKTKIKLIDFVFEKHLNDKSALDDSAEKWFNEYKYSRSRFTE